MHVGYIGRMGNEKLYAPFISYMYEDIKKWLPIEDESMEKTIPEEASSIMKDMGDMNFALFGKDSTIFFGRNGMMDSEKGGIAYLMKFDIPNPEQRVVWIDGKREAKDGIDRTSKIDLSSIIEKIAQEESLIRGMQDQVVPLGSLDMDRISDAIRYMPSETMIEVEQTKDAIIMLPYNGAGGALTLNFNDEYHLHLLQASMGLREKAGALSDLKHNIAFVKAGDLKAVVNAFKKSNANAALLSINSGNDPLVVDFGIYSVPKYTYGASEKKKIGVFSAFIEQVAQADDAKTFTDVSGMLS